MLKGHYFKKLLLRLNRRGVYLKIVTSLIIVIALSFVMTASFLSYWFQYYYKSQRNSQLYNMAQIIQEDAIKYFKNELEYTKLTETLNFVSGASKSDIWVVDNIGILTATSIDSGTSHQLLGSQVVTSDLADLRMGKTVEKDGAFHNEYMTAMHTYEIPIFYQGYFHGAIIMNTYINDLTSQLRVVYSIIWISAAIAIVICGFVVYYISQKIIIKPIKEINYIAGKISKGEVDRRVEITTRDEIGELSHSFNLMADSLAEVDKNRKEFISNVSHELRTPITSIKGFIGGILDGVIPKEKEEYYLKVTYEEIQRLTRLVNDLLDLSAIESGKFTLKLKKIDVNELIRICIIKFEHKIKNKRIKVEVSLQGENLYAFSDKDRTTQVITNLLDNAVKYVEEGGQVKISSKTKGSKVLVSIFNDGPNISELDMKHIWDRFYRADKARASKSSTGLGLPIVRNILTQAGEDIWVENLPNKGVSFTFTLKSI